MVTWSSKSVAVLVAMLLVVLSACGGEEDEAAGTDGQVTSGGSVFVGGDLDDVPVPPLAEPLAPVQEAEGGVLVRSYGVRDSRVQDVMAFYEDLFSERPVVEPVHDVEGSSVVLQGEWRLRDGVLRVTVQQAPTLEDGEAAEGSSVQLSLQLDPG